MTRLSVISELHEYDEIGDGGANHAGQGASTDIKVAISAERPRDRQLFNQHLNQTCRLCLTRLFIFTPIAHIHKCMTFTKPIQLF